VRGRGRRGGRSRRAIRASVNDAPRRQRRRDGAGTCCGPAAHSRRWSGDGSRDEQEPTVRELCRRCARAGPASAQIRRRHSVMGLMHFKYVLLDKGRLHSKTQMRPIIICMHLKVLNLGLEPRPELAPRLFIYDLPHEFSCPCPRDEVLPEVVRFCSSRDMQNTDLAVAGRCFGRSSSIQLSERTLCRWRRHPALYHANQ
jgi:hypothetical protein